MPTRNVVITEHQSALIDDLVESGKYQNASEVLREGIRLIEEREKEQAAKLEALRAAARVGIEELDRGEYREFSDTRSLKAFIDTLAPPTRRTKAKKTKSSR